jgi:class 3 adenylate cyclase
MKKKELSLLFFHGIEIGYSVLLFAWIFFPLMLTHYRGIHYFALPSLLSGPPSGTPLPLSHLLLTAASYLVLLIIAVKLPGPPIARKFPVLARPSHTLPALLDFLSSSAVILFYLLHILKYASNTRYFGGLTPLDYAVLGCSFVFNVNSLARIITVLNRRNKDFREYLVFKRKGKGEEKDLLKRMIRGGIQKKIVLYFEVMFIVIIAVLSSTLMADFKRTILETVIYNGSALTERAASIIKANTGDEIAINDYFEIEKKKKESTAYSFNSITFYQRQGRTEEFIATSSTEENLAVTRLPENYHGIEEVISVYNSERKTYEFLSPVVLSKVLIGYVFVDYDRALIYEPYFRTQVKIIIIGTLFLYLSVFLIYVFGTNIVFPILFLRMGVNKIAKTLSEMIKGKLRISPDLLKYQDRVRTRDEIKGLSGEIHNMTMVIRGILPYISASTLMHSDKTQPSSQARHLAFLFTDIRGFTTICEGLKPGKVVEMLNCYLELQATIIHKNHGDIDKFVGDEIMAMFEDPNKELNACRASMEIRTAMAREKTSRAQAKKRVVSIGIGIHAGPVVFGSVGSPDRMDFTSIGDTVNLAARLEGANKSYGTKALITDTVYRKVKGEFLCREIDFLTVQGKTKPVRIYEVLQEHSRAGEKIHRLKDGFEKGLTHYRQRRWNDAVKSFELLSRKYMDEPSEVFIRRIELYISNPPPKKWDGVFNLTVK